MGDLNDTPIFSFDHEGKSIQILSLCYNLLKSRFWEYTALAGCTLFPLALVVIVAHFSASDGFFARAVFAGQYYFIYRFLLMIVMFLMSLASEGAMIRLTANSFAGIGTGVDNNNSLWSSVKSHLRVSCSKSCTATMAGLFVYIEVLAICTCFRFLDLGISMMTYLPQPASGLLRFVVGLAFALPLMHAITGPFLFFPAIIVENKTISASLKRSWQLAKGRIYFMFTFLFPLGFTRLLLADSMLFVYVKYCWYPNLAGYIIIMSLVTILFLPIQAVLRFVLYAKLRTEKECITQEELQAELAKQGDGYVDAAVIMDEEGEGPFRGTDKPENSTSDEQPEYTPPAVTDGSVKK